MINENSVHLNIISELSARLGDESDYESHLQPLLCQLSEAFDPNPYQEARKAIDTLLTFCENHGVRGIDPYMLDDVYQEILHLEDQP